MQDRQRSTPESCRRQGRDDACYTLRYRISFELIKAVRTSLICGNVPEGRCLRPSGRKHAFESVGQENPDTKQTHYRGYCLEHCKHPSAPRRRKHRATLHSQKDSMGGAYIPDQVGISRNRCLKREQRRLPIRPVNQQPARTTIDSPRQASPHFRLVPVAISSVVGARGGAPKRK